MYPKITINRQLVLQNVKRIIELNRAFGIETTVVTKCIGSWEPYVQMCLEAGATAIGDGRLHNLQLLKHLPVPKWLLRIPGISEAEAVVQYATLSLNSELEVLEALNLAAKKFQKKHQVVIMVELGDLREGVLVADLPEFIHAALQLEHIEVVGLGTNHNCYGGIIPDVAKMTELADLAQAMRTQFNIELPIVSGGGSGTIPMIVDGTMPSGITNLRIGEAMLLGADCSYDERIAGTSDELFTLVGEIVECKWKPSQSWGRTGRDAFGETNKVLEDKGVIKRAIVGLGRLDVHNLNLKPLDPKIEILGASSDHLILDITNAAKSLKIGSEIAFRLSYACLLATCASPHVMKEIIET